jgi:hypothetical protein
MMTSWLMMIAPPLLDGMTQKHNTLRHKGGFAIMNRKNQLGRKHAYTTIAAITTVF